MGCGDHSTNDCKKKLNVLDLFSGIGGFSLGLESAGPFRTIAFCEREPFCQAVLRKHWPDVPIFDDVRTIPTDGLGRIDIIVGGFPCQPWSHAGEQRGAEDDRDLWPEMASLIEKLQPRWVIGENVRGFVSQPMGLERSLSDLESLGYGAVPFIIGACSVDAPHRRDRVWIIAHADSHSEPDGAVNARPRSGELVADARHQRIYKRGQHENARKKSSDQSRVQRDGVPRGKQRKILADADNAKRRRGKVGRSGWDRQSSFYGEIGAVMADASGAGQERAFRRRETETERASEGHTSKCGRWIAEPGMGGMVDGVSAWMDEPNCGRVASGIKNRAPRLTALGNAVVPSVVAQIGRAILEAERA